MTAQPRRKVPPSVQADRHALWRAYLFIALAGILVGSAARGLEQVAADSRVWLWAPIAALAAVNVTGLAPRIRLTAFSPLIDDEATRDHRRRGQAAGFWAATLAAIGIAVALPYAPITGLDVARIVVTAGLATALIGFAVLEIRAGR